MPFQKGNKLSKGRPKGSGRNSQAREWAESYGIPFLMRIAEGKEKDVNMFGKPCNVSLAKRKEAAEYLIDQGLGRAPQRHEIDGGNGGPITVQFVPFNAPDKS